MKFLYLSFVICSVSGGSLISSPLQAEKIGFLVIAPDRGYMGNEEVRDVFQEYRKDFPLSSLAFVPYQNPQPFLQQGVRELKEKRVIRIVALPLFLSHEDPYFKKAKEILQHPASSIQHSEITFAEPMSESHLIAEILVDRVRALSRNPEEEVLFLIGAGASDEREEREIQKDLEKVLEWSEGRFPMNEKKLFVLYDYYAEQERLLSHLIRRGVQLQGQTSSTPSRIIRPKEQDPPLKTSGNGKMKNPSVFLTEVIEFGVKKEPKERIKEELETLDRMGKKAILIPFFLGLKLSPMMSLWNTFIADFKDYEILYDGKELLPHPNVLLWLKMKSYEALFIQRDEIGIILASHGGDFHWNQEMIEACRPLEKEYRIEHAFGMMEPEMIQKAVDHLEAKGAKTILLLRIFALKRSFEEKAKYILGLRKEPLMQDHLNHDSPITIHQSRILSPSLFYTTGGIEDDPLYAEVLMERANEISQDPSKETVILVSHGMGDDGDDDYWHRIQESLARQMRENGGDRFQRVLTATLREDWPEKRDRAVEELRKMVEEVNEEGGEALIIANRINGPGPTENYLQGLSYRFNGEGFLPHPNFIKILKRQIEEGIYTIVKK
ncbi:hypothetical protein IIA15_09245 [candidate division TA06 bacterium]|nr:hypothetical protein [candidate division TA06 bacterium]